MKTLFNLLNFIIILNNKCFIHDYKIVIIINNGDHGYYHYLIAPINIITYRTICYMTLLYFMFIPTKPLNIFDNRTFIF